MTVSTLLMRAILISATTGLLAAQETYPDLQREQRRLRGGSDFALVEIVAQHSDGSPARGVISCKGEWLKHQDEKKRDQPRVYIESLAFNTDSRGAVIFNPWVGDQMDCTAVDEHLHSGGIDEIAYGTEHFHITVR